MHEDASEGGSEDQSCISPWTREKWGQEEAKAREEIW
jgi:hypothetical protein